MSESGVAEDFESIWAEIKLLIEWQRGFGFYLVFSDDDRVSKRLRQRVEDTTRVRTHLLQWVRPEDPATAVDQVLHAAFPEGTDRRFRDRHAPLWIELTAGPGRAEWEKVRREALAALNRRRSALEKECLRPLFLQLPAAMAPPAPANNNAHTTARRLLFIYQGRNFISQNIINFQRNIIVH